MNGKKNLTLTLLENKNSVPVWIGVGDMVSQLDLKSSKRKSDILFQEYMNEEFIKELGNPPYEVTRIDNLSVIGKVFFNLKGEKGEMFKINKDYFIASNN